MIVPGGFLGGWSGIGPLRAAQHMSGALGHRQQSSRVCDCLGHDCNLNGSPPLSTLDAAWRETVGKNVGLFPWLRESNSDASLCVCVCVVVFGEAKVKTIETNFETRAQGPDDGLRIGESPAVGLWCLAGLLDGIGLPFLGHSGVSSWQCKTFLRSAMVMCFCVVRFARCLT